MQQEIIPLFSKCIYVDFLSLNLQPFLKLFENEPMRCIKEKNDSYQSWSQSSKDIFVLERNELNILKKSIMNIFNNYAKNILKYEYNDFKMTTSWLTKTKYKQTSTIHRHRNSMFSGVLYLKTEPKKAKIMLHNFSNETSFKLKISKSNIYNSDTYTFNMSENVIMFFPSEVYHEIVPSEQKTERISLAFNFCPIGNIGEQGSDSFMELQ